MIWLWILKAWGWLSSRRPRTTRYFAISTVLLQHTDSEDGIKVRLNYTIVSADTPEGATAEAVGRAIANGDRPLLVGLLEVRDGRKPEVTS